MVNVSTGRNGEVHQITNPFRHGNPPQSRRMIRLFSFLTESPFDQIGTLTGWTKLGDYSGTTERNLPSTFNELLVVAKTTSGTRNAVFIIPYAILGDSDAPFGATPWYRSETSNQCCGISVSKTKIKGGSATTNGVGDSTDYTVYYH